MWIAQQQYQYSPYTRQLSNRLRPLQAERTTVSPIVKTQRPTGLDKIMPKTRPIGNYLVSNSLNYFSSLIKLFCFYLSSSNSNQRRILPWTSTRRENSIPRWCKQVHCLPLRRNLRYHVMPKTLDVQHPHK